MIIDCQSCPVRDLHCQDCMVTALLGREPGELPLAPAPGELPLLPLPGELPLDSTERAAVMRFVASGLVSTQEGATVQVRRDPWSAHARAVG
jgi:hypothetical protein